MTVIFYWYFNSLNICWIKKKEIQLIKLRFYFSVSFYVNMQPGFHHLFLSELESESFSPTIFEWWVEQYQLVIQIYMEVGSFCISESFTRVVVSI